ncbi:MAG: DUF1761 domain-containing protein [Pseudomonadota bacterium]
MHDIGTPQILHVLVTALAGFVIGGLWYGPLFSKAWMKASGVATGNMSTAQSVRLFASAYVVNVVIAFGLAFLMGQNHSWQGGAHTGFFVSLMFMAMAIGMTYLFERRPLKLFLINAGYQVANCVVMGAVLGAWH